MNDLERPEEDSAEQDQEAVPSGDEPAAGEHEVPLEADEADAAEQERALGLEDDDYR